MSSLMRGRWRRMSNHEFWTNEYECMDVCMIYTTLIHLSIMYTICMQACFMFVEILFCLFHLRIFFSAIKYK
jgi:hypothetical protein